MARKILFCSTLALWGATMVWFAPASLATVPLNRAVVQNLRNQVKILLKNQPVRLARKQDTMVPGDALATARASMADLRFNDQSLARVGERAMFRFVPNTRTFRLDNGTVLMLIPPGRGSTHIRTPNASTAIRGSALFVRHDPDTQTTIVGALTDSQIEVENLAKSQRHVLQAGQIAVLVGDRLERIYSFDLNTFYKTSDLVKGLNLNQATDDPQEDEGIAAVRQETLQALRSQKTFTAALPAESATFIQLTTNAPWRVRSAVPQPDGSLTRALSPFVTSGATEIRAVSQPAIGTRPVEPTNPGPAPQLPSRGGQPPEQPFVAPPATPGPPATVAPAPPLPPTQPTNTQPTNTQPTTFTVGTPQPPTSQPPTSTYTPPVSTSPSNSQPVMAPTVTPVVAPPTVTTPTVTTPLISTPTISVPTVAPAPTLPTTVTAPVTPVTPTITTPTITVTPPTVTTPTITTPTVTTPTVTTPTSNSQPTTTLTVPTGGANSTTRQVEPVTTTPAPQSSIPADGPKSL